MSRTLGAMLLALMLASCGGGYKSAPRDLGDACSIAGQRPKFMKAFKATERKWRVPVAVQMATIYQESKFRSDARTPFRFVLGVIPMGRQSSAYGFSQALDGTWDEYRKDTGRRSARRNRMNDASDFIGWYFNQSLERNSIGLSDARNQYLAYHEGQTGYARASYNRKSWLVRIAGEVQARALTYDAQLQNCRNYRY